MPDLNTLPFWQVALAVAVLGSMIGSFLNVVIYRLPIMLRNSWRRDCYEFLELDHPQKQESTQEEYSQEQGQSQTEKQAQTDEQSPEEECSKEQKHAQATFNLWWPNSTCPYCGHEIKPWENIPVLSYIFLKGRCSNCKTPISLRYPFVEALTALLSVIVIWQLGATAQGLFALLMTWCLIALTMIDADTKLLPDSITLPLLWGGLLINSQGVFTYLNQAVWGAAIGYLTLWSVYWAFKLVTGKEGMGFGDFKLLAALGAWLGWFALPAIVILSSFVGALVGVVGIVSKKYDREITIPFGPYLASAGWITMLWGDSINALYLSMAGLSMAGL